MLGFFVKTLFYDSGGLDLTLVRIDIHKIEFEHSLEFSVLRALLNLVCPTELTFSSYE